MRNFPPVHTFFFFWMMNDDGKTCVKLFITAIAIDVAQYATSYCFEADCAVVLHHIHHSTRRVPAGPKPPRCVLLSRRSYDDSIVGRPTTVCGGRGSLCRLEHLFPPVVHDFLLERETVNYIFLQDEAALTARLLVDKTTTDCGASLCYYA